MNLFAALPEDIRKTVKTQYDLRDKASAEVGKPAGLEFIFSTSPKLNEKELGILKTRRVRKDPSLSGLLVRNKDGFISSRYLFQIPKPNELTFWDYEHHRLALLCGVLCEGLGQCQTVPQLTSATSIFDGILPDGDGSACQFQGAQQHCLSQTTFPSGGLESACRL